MENLAAIDIGSNAIRLVIGGLNRMREIEVTHKVRDPVRLGEDVFSTGAISKKTMLRSLETFHKFKRLIRESDVEHVRAVATSALREAKNRQVFVDLMKRECGINVQIIDGLEEARLIHTAVANKVDLQNQTCVAIDIGGGSVEVTVSVKGRIRALQSFKLGTVRMMQLLKERGLKERHLKTLIRPQLSQVREFLADATRGRRVDVSVGTGGNFECLGKLRVALLNKNSIHSMSRDELQELNDHLQSMSVKERIQFLRLRPDRADVVVPAGIVISCIMDLIPTQHLNIPYVGLRDGILSELASGVTVPRPRTVMLTAARK